LKHEIKTENQSSTKDYVTFKFFSVMNAALSGIIRSLDFCSPFHQGKGEMIKNYPDHIALQNPHSSHNHLCMQRSRIIRAA
jgi:hypothetical protein